MIETCKIGGNFNIGGVFELSCYDSDGNLKWIDSFKNGVTNIGLHDLLEVYFRQGTPLAGFAVGLISSGAVLSSGDTHDSHAGWSEFITYNVGGNALIRPAWVADPPSAKSVANSVLMDFTVTNAGTISGVFLAGGVVGATSPGITDADRKGSSNATPILWATALLTDGNQSVVGNDVLRLTYLVRAASA